MSIPTPHGRTAALLCLASAAFLSVTTEMVPVGLLPSIGDAFGVPESLAGLLVSLYAVMVAALAVPLTLATRRFSRKPLLLTTLAGYAVSNGLVAVAPVFAVVAAGRTLGGLTHALFFSILIGYTPRLVAGTHVGRALAIVAGGASTGLVLGVPLSTSLGNALGWRSPFMVLTAASLLTLALVAWKLPAVGDDPADDVTGSTGHGALIAVSSANALVFLGQFTLYTFISLVLLGSGVSQALIGPILLVCGACGLVGIWYAGRHLDRRPARTVVVIYAVLVGAIVALGFSWPAAVAVAIAAAIWNGAFGAVPSIFQNAALRTRAVSPDLAGAWTNATANVGIAGGAALGAGILNVAGLWLLPWVSAALIATSLLVMSLSHQLIGAKSDFGVRRRAPV